MVNILDDLKTYYVTYKVEARYVAKVKAKSLAEAREEAASKYFDADFGEAYDIDGKPITVENENGDFIWEQGDDWREAER